MSLRRHEQDAVPRRVARGAQHHDRAVAEHVLVRALWLDLALLGDPLLEALRVRTAHRRAGVDAVPIALADKQRRVPERPELAGVVGVEMADADVFHVIGIDVDLLQQIGAAACWSHWEPNLAGIPCPRP